MTTNFCTHCGTSREKIAREGHPEWCSSGTAEKFCPDCGRPASVIERFGPRCSQCSKLLAP